MLAIRWVFPNIPAISERTQKLRTFAVLGDRSHLAFDILIYKYFVFSCTILSSPAELKSTKKQKGLSNRHSRAVIKEKLLMISYNIRLLKHLIWRTSKRKRTQMKWGKMEKAGKRGLIGWEKGGCEDEGFAVLNIHEQSKISNPAKWVNWFWEHWGLGGFFFLVVQRYLVEQSETHVFVRFLLLLLLCFLLLLLRRVTTTTATAAAASTDGGATTTTTTGTDVQ